MSVIEKLILLQEHDCRIRDMEKELRDIPARKQRETSRLEEHKQRMATSEQDGKTHQAAMKKIELEIEARKEKITKLRQQQYELKTNKEFKAMEAEIGAIQAEISGLEDQQLEIMLGTDATKAETEAHRKALVQEEAAVQRDVKSWDERAGALNQELERLRALRMATAAEIDKEWIRSYERIFAKKDKALVPVADGICGGCHMQLPPFLIHDARKHSSMVYCTFCGRLLY